MIKTFIFFDLETTGFIGKVMPKITELSLIAVSRRAVCETMNDLPRILHKLVLPIHPNINISTRINEITGISNNNLREVSCFNSETYDLIMDFINRLPAPICFVAYNGNKFDYPIFLSELKHINKDFSEDIFSIDMLDLVKDYFLKDRNLIEKEDVQNAPSVSNSEGASSLLNDGCDEILCDALDNVMSSTSKKNNQENNENNSCSNSGRNTPKNSCYEEMQKVNEKTPENQIIKLQDAYKSLHFRKRSSARKKLHFTKNKPDNFKLQTIYKHILGAEPVSVHTAEGDCLIMIHCAIQFGKYFVEWADYKATPFVKYERH